MRYIEHASERTMRGNAIRNERKEIALSAEHFSSSRSLLSSSSVRHSTWTIHYLILLSEREKKGKQLFQSRTITFSADVSNVINDPFRLNVRKNVLAEEYRPNQLS